MHVCIIHGDSTGAMYCRSADSTGAADGSGKVDFDAETVLKMLESMLGKGRGEEEGTSDSSDSGSVGSEEEGEMRELMEEMDRELVAKGFKSSLDPEVGAGGQGDISLAHNLLSSLSAQPEAAGPASNILHSLGIPVPESD